MKNKTIILVSLLGFFLLGVTSVQATDSIILLKAIGFNSSEGEPSLPENLYISEYPPGIRGYYIAQFTGNVNETWKEELRQTGCEIYDYIPENAFVVRMDLKEKEAVQNMSFVQWVGIYQPFYKISPRLSDAEGEVNITVLSFRTESKFIPELESLGGNITSNYNFSYYDKNVLTINASKIDDIALMNDTYWIEPYIEPELFDEVSDEIVGGYWAAGTPWDGPGTYVNSLGYNGSGVLVSIADTGLDDGNTTTMHLDMMGRVVGLIDYTESDTSDGVAEDVHGHGTHCAGIVAGNAAIGTTDADGYLYGMGVAPEASIMQQRVFGDDGSWKGPANGVLAQDAVQNGADVGSNSWGMNTFGDYTSDDAEFDALVRDADSSTPGNQQYILEFSAGNAGPVTGSIGSPASAKNVIATGASENYRPNLPQGWRADNVDEIADFSSRGPCEDGRIKPDIVAPGTWISSALSSSASQGWSWNPDYGRWGNINSDYEWCGGTSMAGPHVSGGAALFVEYHRETHGSTPSPALTKAALISSADDVGLGYPSNDQGWGEMNLTNVINPQFVVLEDQSVALATGGSHAYNIMLSDYINGAKITLVWTDAPGSVSASKALVNDLDLVVTAPDGTTYHGNQFSGAWSDPTSGDFDRVNNIENVFINAGNIQSGTYQITVLGYNVPAEVVPGGQDYALVIAPVGRTPPMPPPADILIVDDDQGANYETYYKNALHANGYNYSYCSSPPDASVLLNYSVVIWLTGDDYTSTLTPTEQANLQTYLNNGGNLFISGQDIGYDIGGSSFYHDYLHANYVRDDTDIYTLNGVSGDPISDGLTIGISGGDGANNQWYQSEISPRDESASTVFNYAGDGCGAIKADTGTYKVVYFAFGFEAINNTADRNMVMDRVMRWLMMTNYTFYLRVLQNYVSMPVLPPEGERSPDDVFGRDVGVWEYDTEAGNWERTTEVACKKGYYIYNPWMPKNITVTGVPCDVSVTDLIAIYSILSVGQWALVGPGYENISITGTVLEGEVEGYNYTINDFEQVCILEVGRGYWMTGGPLWTKYSTRIDSETQCLGVGGIAVDSEDNVIIASNRDVIKYDPNGNVLWEYDLCGCGVAVDKTDNSIVVGLCNSSVIKFSKTGSILWIEELQEELWLSSVKSINPEGDILVSGFGRVDGVFKSYYEIRDKNGNFIRSTTRPHNGWWPSAVFAEPGYIYLAYDLAQGVAIEKVTDDFSSTLWTTTLSNCSQYVSTMSVDSGNNLFVRG
ncbi:hypothetical protein CW714_00750, partial [Methanophagales archaeon]